MKVLLLLLLPFLSFGQDKWYSITKNDAAVMALELAAGYGQGWRDEVLYHPNQLFKQYPNLNRRFWDIRVQDKPGFLNTEWDADHVLKGAIASLHVAAVVFKIGERKQNWKKYLFDAVKYYGSYKLGFFLSYNLTHKNSL